MLVSAVPAQAGKPGTWTMATPASGNTAEVGMARLPNGTLNVLWTQGKQVLNTQIAADGSAATGQFPVFTYMDGVNDSVALTRDGTGLRAFFAGLFPRNPLDVVMATATSADGKTWAVQPTGASNRRRPRVRPSMWRRGSAGS